MTERYGEEGVGDELPEDEALPVPVVETSTGLGEIWREGVPEWPSRPLIAEDDLAIQCAMAQAPRDMIHTPVRALAGRLHKKQNLTGEDLVVHGQRWYILVDLENLTDQTGAVALYRVWRNEQSEFQAVRVEFWSREEFEEAQEK